MSINRENIACRPGTTDEIQRLADENEALRAERDALAARVERVYQALTEALVKWGCMINEEDPRYNACCDVRYETPAQSLAHIRAGGAREALERTMSDTGFSGTVVRVDVMREIIEQMEGE